jgi:hypothetical protein
MNCDITLLALLNGVMEHNVIRPSRIGPIRTAIKQYAEILGYNGPAQCPSAVFAKTDKVRNRLIEERAPQKLGSDALRNLKNNISYILRTGIELGIISAFSSELASWKDSNGVALLPKRNEYVPTNIFSIPFLSRLKRQSPNTTDGAPGQAIERVQRVCESVQYRFHPTAKSYCLKVAI